MGVKSVFITGAGAGIGRAIAEKFAKQGWYVGLYDLDESAVKDLYAQLGEGRSCYKQCDVTDEASIASALAHFSEKTGGRLDVFVNNAGVLFGGNFQEVPPEQHALMIDVNVKGLTSCAQAAYKLLEATPGACLINLCSASSIYGIPGLAVYGASKAYVKALTEALSIEWERDDIRVASVMPPFVKTGLLEKVPQQLFKKMGVDLKTSDVANTVYRAVKGKRVHYLMSSKALLWGELERHLPWRLRRGLVKFLASY